MEALSWVPPPLLDWYDREARALPWRAQPTPYRVWVSEIMLQQTRVEAALPYFERFVSALPDVAALAYADEAALMKLWEGLGYYSRARNLQKAARAVMERHGGVLPGSVEELVALPGIGDYTAGAIVSIAFGVAAEAVDGNVLRVLSRLLASQDDVSSPSVRQRFRAIARGMLPKERPGDFNQALMDLGATVCLPNGAPRCGACPLAGLCAGHSEGIAGALPVKAGKAPRDIARRTVFIIRNQGRALLVKRLEKGLLAGLWELPAADGWLEQGEAMDFLRQYGAAVHSLKRIENARHVFSHVEWHMRGWLADADAFSPAGAHAWADSPALRHVYTVPSAFKTYRKYLEGNLD